MNIERALNEVSAKAILACPLIGLGFGSWGIYNEHVAFPEIEARSIETAQADIVCNGVSLREILKDKELVDFRFNTGPELARSFKFDELDEKLSAPGFREKLRCMRKYWDLGVKTGLLNDHGRRGDRHTLNSLMIMGGFILAIPGTIISAIVCSETRHWRDRIKPKSV